MWCCSVADWDKGLHLRQTPLDGAIPYKIIDDISVYFDVHDFNDNDVIVERGAISDKVYAVVSGHAYLHLQGDKKEPARVHIGVNNFIGGWGLLEDEKVVEPAQVVGRGRGKYVTLERREFKKMQQTHPEVYNVVLDLIGLRLAILKLPFFHSVVSDWPQDARHIFASLFRYQAFDEHEELIAESGKAADRLIILVKGSINLANMRKGDDVYNIQEDGKLLNLTSLFYNFGLNYWDVMAVPESDKFTQVMCLHRSDFRKFYSAGIVDCYSKFEQASIEYLLREMRAQHRLFFHIVEEKFMQEFCSLWKLKEYGENVKIAMKKDVDLKEAGAHVTKSFFHVIVGGSADAYSTERQVQNNKQMKKAHRYEFVYGCGVGILSNKLAALNADLTLFSGKTRCLMLTLERHDFDQFFQKIGRHEAAMNLAEQSLAQAPKHHSQTSQTPGYPSRLGESPSRSMRDMKFMYTNTGTGTGTAISSKDTNTNTNNNAMSNHKLTTSDNQGNFSNEDVHRIGKSAQQMKEPCKDGADN